MCCVLQGSICTELVRRLSEYSASLSQDVGAAAEVHNCRHSCILATVLSAAAVIY